MVIEVAAGGLTVSISDEDTRPRNYGARKGEHVTAARTDAKKELVPLLLGLEHQGKRVLVLKWFGKRVVTHGRSGRRRWVKGLFLP